MAEKLVSCSRQKSCGADGSDVLPSSFTVGYVEQLHAAAAARMLLLLYSINSESLRSQLETLEMVLVLFSAANEVLCFIDK